MAFEGWIEPGESPEQALRRELIDELHCAVEIVNQIETTKHESTSGRPYLS
ncbi:NUDIX domain-containing protein [Homoserinimonas sp. OAct 916]|uniref:NUDIX domain-containing protein n=1 Tax=Homoserinimonas sp. OAct 916 TaxID=2211450 RepID=UPI001300BA87